MNRAQRLKEEAAPAIADLEVEGTADSLQQIIERTAGLLRSARRDPDLQPQNEAALVISAAVTLSLLLDKWIEKTDQLFNPDDEAPHADS